MKTTYRDLISGVRLRPSTAPDASDRELAIDALSDLGRIVTSSSFRRLQTKAQVFSLEQNASVRSRLTHTLEVAFLGKWLAQDTFNHLAKSGAIDPELGPAFVQTVENACLLHDIGNPPFGHLGEHAIQRWFERWDFRKYWPEEARDAGHQDSFLHFDGNAQGFRMVTRLRWLHDHYGLNLTCSLLASTLKYLRSKPATEEAFANKIGFFASERDVVQKIWENLELRFDDGRAYLRHPLTFLMEAADDIAYCLSDIEDAIEKRIVTLDEFFSSLREGPLQALVEKAEAEGGATSTRNAAFVVFRVLLNRFLGQAARAAYLENHEAILDGSQMKSLLEDSEPASSYLDALKKFAGKHIFVSREAVDIELSGYRVVQGLLTAFEPVLALDREVFTRLLKRDQTSKDRRQYPLEIRLMSLLSNKQKMLYEHQTEDDSSLEQVWRTHLVVDFVSGMTDSHALKVFHMLRGISVGVSG